jgi:glycosyltransferase 2 family protein
MNLFIPRAGEASRAVSIQRTEKVPFEQGFGTVLAERAVDTLLLALIGGVTVWMQLDKLDLFRERIGAFRAEQGEGASASASSWSYVVLGALLLALVVGAVLLYRNLALRAKAVALLRGFGAGLQAVFRTRNKVRFVLLSLLIWGCYLGMFRIGFFCLPGMSDVPMAGVLAGFVAGAIGIVLVQGGIGVYPAFVGLIVSVYMGLPEDGGLIRPDALALGWMLWLVQTLLLIVLGGLSLLLLALQRPRQ